MVAHLNYTDTMDGKGREVTYIFFSHDALGTAGGRA